jgi:hypothetical protein
MTQIDLHAFLQSASLVESESAQLIRYGFYTLGTAVAAWLIKTVRDVAKTLDQINQHLFGMKEDKSDNGLTGEVRDTKRAVKALAIKSENQGSDMTVLRRDVDRVCEELKQVERRRNHGRRAEERDDA